MNDPRPVAAIWRTQWLPRSETFIRDHVVSMQRYRPLTLGISNLPEGLGFTADRAPLPANGPLKRLEGLSRRTGWLGLHDDVIRRQKPRLLHAHFGTDAMKALPVVNRHRLPFAITFHGYDVQDAEINAAEDKKKVDLVQAKNQGDAMVHSVKKSLTDYGDKLDAGEKDKIEAAMKAVEEGEGVNG